MVEEMSVDELHGRLEAGDYPKIVDIRPEQSFRAGHIPFTRFTATVDEIEWDDEIVVVCPKGESSLQTARLLESYEGVDEDARVANRTGGYREWEYDLKREA
jgi:rhodanese-related sulfurtransferase